MIRLFAIQKEEASSREGIAVHQTCILEKWPVKIVRNPDEVPFLYTPCGSVEWVLAVLKAQVVPDYYPDFLQPYLHREVWKAEEWPLGKKVFIKPADKYKRFTGFITNGGYRKKKNPPYWCSDIVSFQNEWRYYISNGKILASGWYWGDENKMPDPPSLDIDFPSDYCGAVDFGTLENGELALVEANHPFACGWYGKNHKAYVQWIIDGWEYVKRNYKNV